jgi:hypothetical protein
VLSRLQLRQASKKEGGKHALSSCSIENGGVGKALPVETTMALGGASVLIPAAAAAAVDVDVDNNKVDLEIGHAKTAGTPLFGESIKSSGNRLNIFVLGLEKAAKKAATNDNEEDVEARQAIIAAAVAEEQSQGSSSSDGGSCTGASMIN